MLVTSDASDFWVDVLWLPDILSKASHPTGNNSMCMGDDLDHHDLHWMQDTIHCFHCCPSPPKIVYLSNNSWPVCLSISLGREFYRVRKGQQLQTIFRGLNLKLILGLEIHHTTWHIFQETNNFSTNCHRQLFFSKKTTYEFFWAAIYNLHLPVTPSLSWAHCTFVNICSPFFMCFTHILRKVCVFVLITCNVRCLRPTDLFYIWCHTVYYQCKLFFGWLWFKVRIIHKAVIGWVWVWILKLPS